MIDPKTCKVKLIDFDLSHKFGESYSAAGNPDFINEDILNKIEASKKIKATPANDNYSLGICCFLVLGDVTKEYLASLSADALSFKKRELLINKQNFIGKAIVQKLLKNEITAIDASMKLHELLLITGAADEMKEAK